MGAPEPLPETGVIANQRPRKCDMTFVLKVTWHLCWNQPTYRVQDGSWPNHNKHWNYGQELNQPRQDKHLYTYNNKTIFQILNSPQGINDKEIWHPLLLYITWTYMKIEIACKKLVWNLKNWARYLDFKILRHQIVKQPCLSIFICRANLQSPLSVCLWSCFWFSGSVTLFLWSHWPSKSLQHKVPSTHETTVQFSVQEYGSAVWLPVP